MQDVSRRKALQLGSAVLPTSLAGCVSFFEQPSITLGQVEIANQRAEPYTVHLLVEHDDELVYWSSFDLKPATNQETGVTKIDSVAIEDEWPASPGQFAIHIRLDTQSSWRSLTLDEQDGGCQEVLALIDRAGEPPASVSILTTNHCQS